MDRAEDCGVSDADWEAAIARAFAAVRDMKIRGVPKYHRSLVAAKEAADAFAACRGFHWKQHRKRTKTTSEKHEATKKLKHCAKCKTIKEDCLTCTRERRLAVEIYRDTFEGTAPDGRVIAHLFVDAECICPHNGTRCLGCVLAIAAIEFPITPHAPLTSKLRMPRPAETSPRGGKRACPDRHTKRAPPAKRARTSTLRPTKRSLAFAPSELPLSPWGPLHVPSTPSKGALPPRPAHGWPPTAREQAQDQAPTTPRPFVAFGTSPLIFQGTVVFVNTENSQGTNVNIHDITSRAGGLQPTPRQAHVSARQRQLDFAPAELLPALYESTDGAHDEECATTNAADPDAEYDGGDGQERSADEADDRPYATPATATPLRRASTIRPPPPPPRARGQPRRRHRASAQHTPDHQIDDEAAMAGVTNSPAAPAVAAGGNIEISFEANGNQNSAISISNIGSNH